MKMVMTGIVAVYLGILGIRDFRKKEIPIVWLVTGTTLFLGFCVMRILRGELLWTESVLGMLPGVGMLLIAQLTKNAGYADGVVLAQLGILLGYRHCLVLFAISLAFAAIVSAGLLAVHRARWKSQIPYLPFVGAAYIVQIIFYNGV